MLDIDRTDLTAGVAGNGRLGPTKILTVLEAMHAFYREPRYRPSPWLQRRAWFGVSLLTPES